MADVTRLRKELVVCKEDEEVTGVSVVPTTGEFNPKSSNCDNLRHLIGTITGPKDTVYENGIFKVDIQIPSSYPFEPPKMKFMNKIWHPNISSQTGAICLDILKDQWSPALTLKTALVSLQALLSAPEPHDPQDAQVAQQYLNDRKKFEETARYWTKTYASDKDPLDEKTEKFISMGFPKEKVLDALKSCNGNEEAAMEKLLGDA
mmetsp:Transcript_1379/g.1774  ORF Transcript_1379/g.1774 Transcript_1379/m.1774 type:complete len:205 (+) Transcript_1379:141-755(+)|eukprot:CAMPEP_0204831556 /NCGR_PEP_ID=MMETSP1346-20131115/10850_1 /ASSEMBLY_ACC=CAM_ASM_000771 /TAXON_ID=215587 /ORGANISM="Aplanochytrium stocchinoi, Strain GSBS06" /LENGTH=204 /DNA_ID=CAMNT_0051962655 /DNA_START=128 /DNA_END=742 /DNA_ORIENTATION=+